MAPTTFAFPFDRFAARSARWLPVLLAVFAACRSGGSAPAPAASPTPTEALGPAGEATSTTAPDAPSDVGTTEAADARPDDPPDGTADEPADEATTVTEPEAPAFAPCAEPPPEGMVCIPGGPFWRGSDDEPNERPRSEVVVSTFYIDRTEVTNEAFRECIRAGECELTRHYDSFEEPQQPVVAIDWFNARAYCLWAGKRLPTEAEWEKASRGTDGRTYPWGEEPATCARSALRGCEPDTTRPVGSFGPGAWGLVDMAGNAYEFVQDWYSSCYRGCMGECGADCDGPDPRGPCGGADECPGRDRRILKGGSWYWGPDRARSSHRRPMRADHRGHRLGFRCAMSVSLPPPTARPPATARPLDPTTARPPTPTTAPPLAPPRPLAPTTARPPTPVPPLPDAQRTTFEGVPQEPSARAPVDERHYVQTNEPRHDAYFPWIDGVGGGYLGVGADQNYTLIGRARSELVWLFDYDVVVTQAHRVFRALVLEAPAVPEFLALWEPDAHAAAVAAIEQAEVGAEDLAELTDLFREIKVSMRGYFNRLAEQTSKGVPITWLSDPASYEWVRGLFRAGRVRIVKADLLGDTTLPAIAAAHAKLGVPMRVVYLSNAEAYFFYDDSFRTAVAAMPADDRSFVLRTVNLPQFQGEDRSIWHYQVEPLAHFAAALAEGGIDRAADLHGRATYTRRGGISLLGIARPDLDLEPPDPPEERSHASSENE